ncbi:hypothetical protein [Streptomyces sp. NPDC048516]|uniref:hypothetical protein n=1 Tax=Streptomyces sp. NPDC048516 TaxID=3365565 RepID=UPI003713494A
MDDERSGSSDAREPTPDPGSASAVPPPPSRPPDAPPPPGPAPDPADSPPPPDEDWWRWPAVRDELRDEWTEQSAEALEATKEIGAQMGAALEIGAQIGDAIADRLPDPYAAADKKGLDLRWLRLGINVPALLIAGAAWWWRIGPAVAVAEEVRGDGILAPFGWVLLVLLLVGVLMLLPLGSMLASALSALVTQATSLVWAGLVKAWRTRYLGYLLRLVLAVIAWVVIIGVVRMAWRLTITWLTGV